MPRMASSSLRASVPIFFIVCAALADQNSLLSFALDVKRGADAIRVFLLFETVEKHGDGVRNFFARGQNGLLANHFGGQETLGLIGELIWREIGGAFGKTREPAIHQIWRAFAGERGNGENFGEIELLAGSDRSAAASWGFLTRSTLFRSRNTGPSEAAAPTRWQIDRRRRTPAEASTISERMSMPSSACCNFVHHLPAEDVFRLVNSGRIDEDDLRVVAIQDSLNAIARGLRLRRNDGDFAPDERVDKSGFAGVGAADNGDESRFEWQLNIVR